MKNLGNSEEVPPGTRMMYILKFLVNVYKSKIYSYLEKKHEATERKMSQNWKPATENCMTK